MTYSTLSDTRHSTTDTISLTMPRILIVEDNPELVSLLKTVPSANSVSPQTLGA